MTDDPNKMMQKDREALLKLRQNLSVEADDDSVGSGLLVVHDDRHAEVQNQKEEKRRRERESHNRTLHAMQDYIDGLQEKIDYHRNEARKYQQKIQEADEAIASLLNGEPLELTSDGRLKNVTLEDGLVEWEKRNGKVDRTDSAALLAAIQSVKSEWVEGFEFHDRHVDDLEQTKANAEAEMEKAASTGDHTRINQMAKEFTAAEAINTALTSENAAIQDLVKNDIRERKKSGRDIEHQGQEDFMEMFASAREKDVTENFNLAASGKVRLPAQEYTQDIGMSGMQINLNPMG